MEERGGRGGNGEEGGEGEGEVTQLATVRQCSPIAVRAKLSHIGLLSSSKGLYVSEVEEIKIFPQRQSGFLQLLVGGVTWY